MFLGGAGGDAVKMSATMRRGGDDVAFPVVAVGGGLMHAEAACCAFRSS